MSTEMIADPSLNHYEDHVNPQWVHLLDLLQMNLTYERCIGSELYTTDGERILDFLSGYCVHNTGHNHPQIIAALHRELDRHGPAMLQSHVPELAGLLGARLCELAGGGLTKVFFPNSGSEGIETAIKFARARTGRTGLLSMEGAFHGLTCGALSLMDSGYWSDGFGPFLPGSERIPFGDIEAVRKKLATRNFAAFVLEPIQAEAGIRMHAREYMQEVQALCRKYGTLLVMDEVQTGMYRTGPFLASHDYGIEPDMVILAKALSGGLVPCAAVLMTDPIYKAVFSSLKKAFVHASTFSENSLAMSAGLATLDVLRDEALGKRATEIGSLLRDKLRNRLSKYEMVKDIRGAGMLNGIEFGAPAKMSLKIPFETFQHIHPALFGQMVVMRMFRQGRMLTQICGNHFMVLKVAPPLVVTEPQIDEFVDAMDRVLGVIHASTTFWTDAISLGRRAVTL